MTINTVKQSLRSLHKASLTDDDIEQLDRENAALRIQRAWRARKRASYLRTDILWTDLVTHARFKVDRNAAEQGKNTARERWRRSIFLALRLQDGNRMLADRGVHDEKVVGKYLETQHWLELIDGKHRYGANLKYYHRRWQQEDTNENFFHWLDRGGGQNLSLKECPREQLERERIAYLSPSQRLNYLVQIDNEGKLRWAKSGELVDTSAGLWKDAGEGRGVIPVHGLNMIAERDSARRTSFEVTSVASHESRPNTTLHYYLPHESSPGSKVKRWLWRNFTPRGLLERLLRATLQKNTWIYVADKQFNIFVGIKTPGAFQHSSFLGGGIVTSAGLISVKEGVIHKLSPLSGHYRTSIKHFRYFLSMLDQRGVDMHKVEISKAEAALWGIEHIARFKKKQAKVIGSGKRSVARTAGSIRRKFNQSEHHNGESQGVECQRQSWQPADGHAECDHERIFEANDNGFSPEAAHEGDFPGGRSAAFHVV